MPRLLLLLTCLNIVLSTSMPVQADHPQWIWDQTTQDGQRIWLRKSFELTELPAAAKFAASCDNHFIAYLNGEQIARSDAWEQFAVTDVTKRLKPGKNVLAIEAWNDGGIAAFLGELRQTHNDKSTTRIVSDDSWKLSPERHDGWQRLTFDDSAWRGVKVLGTLGQRGLAWTREINVDRLESALGSGDDGTFVVRAAPEVTVPEGFVVEKVFQVPRSMGSWVALTADEAGRLYASDQGGSGIFRITPGATDEATSVEKMPIDLSGAQGLLWAFDSLYVMVNGGNKSGLHRAWDSNSDGLLDTSEHLMHVPGGGEHGPHAIVLSPDGESLYVCAGNHTRLPSEVQKSRIPMNWDEDLLLPRRWDANGHAAGVLAPGGWICKVDPTGKDWEVVSMGYRNQYDIAFNADGELFSYDADMEWDLGSPWYRPTRVTHATSGSEFGWRSGTGKWPTYYEDSLPPTIDIGPGSPTGIVFGYGAKFPAKYQQALFILDWTYSTIFAIHLTPDGASYKAVKEDFATASPLQVTDADVATDGNLYFAVGGRGTQSALYRVRYTGEESTAPANPHDTEGQALRTLRHSLEAFHGQPNGDLDLIFENLGHADRFIRYAARIALEWQPLDNWFDRSLSSTDLSPLARINALLAASRQGTAAHSPAVLGALTKLGYADLSHVEKLALLRTTQLAFIRLGEPEAPVKQRLAQHFDQFYPAATDQENAELVQLLVYLGSPHVVEKTLALMDALGPEEIPDWSEIAQRHTSYGGTVNRLLENMPPIRGIHYAFTLRNATEGWTLDLRRRYFEFFLRAAQHPGGNSYAKFLMQMREDAFATVPADEKVILDPVASQALIAPLPQVPPAKGPGRKWTTADALAVLAEPLQKRNFRRGRELFHATSCVKCHRYNAEGGAVGPDLSLAGKKFPLPDLLDSIIEPSKVISDQYGSHQLVTEDGEVLVGRVVEIDNKYHVYLADADATLKVIDKAQVEQIQPSKISQMPLGLIDSLNPEELKDLLAYLLSGGDERSQYYR